MDLINDIKDTLVLQNPGEKSSKLEQLSDVFEYAHGLNEADIVEGTKLLLAAALQEKDQSMKGPLFYAIYTAVVH